MSSGSQFVSTMATTGIASFRASCTAIPSFFGSITKRTSGSSSISLIPIRFFASLAFSRSRWIRSFFVRIASEPSASIASISLRRATDFRIVTKFVRVPPSQRLFT